MSELLHDCPPPQPGGSLPGGRGADRLMLRPPIYLTCIAGVRRNRIMVTKQGPLGPKKCLGCGGTFIGRSNGVQYCSHACSRAAAKRRSGWTEESMSAAEVDRYLEMQSTKEWRLDPPWERQQ